MLFLSLLIAAAKRLMRANYYKLMRLLICRPVLGQPAQVGSL